MENLILLDSTWVDLHNEHIIWYALAHIFYVALDLCFSIINSHSYTKSFAQLKGLGPCLGFW
jgi:hypothetical protein